MWVPGFIEKCHCLIKFDIVKSKRFNVPIIIYSAADYLEMIIIFEECGRNATEAARVFPERSPDRNHPGHTVIVRVIARTHETGQVLPNRKESGGPPMTAYS
jgi:hypothetical protein